MRSVVIAGAGLAGSRCAETLRARGFDGRITLVGEEDVGPYERPALSKEFLIGERRAEELALRPRSFWEKQGIELLLGRRIVALRDGSAWTSDGLQLTWDRFVVATGAQARVLPFEAPDGVHVLRTLQDAVALRLALRPGARLVVIGGGFVGTEVASTARALGVEVAMIEAAQVPFFGLLGAEVGDALARRFRAHGVRVLTAAGAVGFDRDSRNRVTGVRLHDGRTLTGDVALVAVGAEPARNLLEPALPGVEVCGDAAGGPGHWTSAAAGGTRLACRLLGIEPPSPQASYFWSDQFGLRLQLVGDPRGASRVQLDGRDDDFVARYLGEDGALLAALAANRPGEIGPLRRELALAA